MLLSLVVLVVMAAVGVLSIDSPNPSYVLKSEMEQKIKELERMIEEFRSESADGRKTSGGWSQWTRWYTCTVTCGGGVQIRERKCDSPVPTTAAGNCVGASHETKPCNSYACPAPEIVRDGGWGEWATWYKCSVSCGGGVKMRDRECDNPPPNHRGRGCVGKGHEFAVCGSEQCPALGSDFVGFCIGIPCCREYNGQGTVPFDKALYNAGSHFHYIDHSFYAPVKGMYSFSVSGTAGDCDKSVDLHLRYQIGHDKTQYKEWANIYSESGPKLRNAAATVIVQMEKYGRVYVHQGQYGSVGWAKTFFCGMLVQRLE